MNVFTFQNRFKADILVRRKLHTIRSHRKDGRPRAKVGETISLRVWTGKPYRSKQREFARAVVTEIDAVAIFVDGISLRAGTPGASWCYERSGRDVLDGFARREGFVDWTLMRDWFENVHGLPFEGVLVKWKLTWAQISVIGADRRP